MEMETGSSMPGAKQCVGDKERTFLTADYGWLADMIASTEIGGGFSASLARESGLRCGFDNETMPV
jgi:hypothetical protein